MSSTATLPEPQVLARAKHRLFPDSDEADTYAVTDTQFARAEWLPGERIADEVRDQLAPFNHVRVGSGYPDLVGVRRLEPGLLETGGADDRPPLVAVEAKGDTETGEADVERGLVQAHDRLAEVNAAYVAAPRRSVAPAARSLARELNVGLLGVTPDGAVEPLEVPRVVGNRTSEEAAAVRFQATAQGVADQSFGLNHPKNYLGVPLALVAPGDGDALLAEYVVGATADARRGAAFLGLVADAPDGPTLTSLGEEVVRFALDEEGSVEAALDRFADWRRSRRRFTEVAPSWGRLTRRVVWSYPATKLLVDELQALHDEGRTEPSLPAFVAHLHADHPTFAVELFVRGTAEARGRVLDGDGGLVREALTDGAVYHAPTVFQLKAVLFHAGVLTERGREPSALDPETDVWALRSPLPTPR